MKYCPYCPLTRCLAGSKEDCWAEATDDDGEPSESQLEAAAENVGVALWERV